MKKTGKYIASIYVDGQLITSSSEQKENVKFHAAKIVQKLSHKLSEINPINQLNEDESRVKQKLHKLYGKKKWPKPIYKIQKTFGHAYEKRFVCSAKVKIANHILIVSRKEKSRVKKVENAATYLMIHIIKNCNCT